MPSILPFSAERSLLPNSGDEMGLPNLLSQIWPYRVFRTLPFALVCALGLRG